MSAKPATKQFRSTRRPTPAALRKAMRETENIMTDHSTKINRARKASVIGDCPGSFAAMVDLVPASARATLTGRQIGELADAMWRACQQSKAIAAREAIDEGAVWDARSGRLREIAA